VPVKNAGLCKTKIKTEKKQEDQHFGVRNVKALNKRFQILQVLNNLLLCNLPCKY